MKEYHFLKEEQVGDEHCWINLSKSHIISLLLRCVKLILLPPGRIEQQLVLVPNVCKTVFTQIKIRKFCHPNTLYLCTTLASGKVSTFDASNMPKIKTTLITCHCSVISVLFTSSVSAHKRKKFLCSGFTSMYGCLLTYFQLVLGHQFSSNEK